MILTTNVWENFWNEVVASFEKFFAGLKDFWLGNETQQPFLANFIFALLFLIVGIFIVKLILGIIRKAFKIDKKVIKDVTLKSFLLSVIKVCLYFILIIVVLSILRVDLSSTTQIFSSAILAVGLSLQDVISNFASGVIILTNKPFVVGDYVDIANGEAEGTVVDVKFLVTTIETIEKQMITIPNKNITGSVIKNYSRNPLRRITLNIGVDYATNIEKCKKVILDVVNKDNRILEDPTPVVYLTGYNDSSVTVSLRCYVPNVLYWSILFSLNEKLLLALRTNGINIPFNRLVISTVKE